MAGSAPAGCRSPESRWRHEMPVVGSAVCCACANWMYCGGIRGPVNRGGRKAPGNTEQCWRPFLSGYTVQEAEDTLYAEVARGNAVACFDVQAIPAMDRGVGRYWYPHVSATVVLAVDRTRTDAEITGWNSLLENRVPVGIGSLSVIRTMMAVGALSYGLNPEEPAKQDALMFLEHLFQNGGFDLDKPDFPILVCLDYEAAAWNRNGGKYEIVVPREGTISYQMGLLSDVPLTLEPGFEEALLSAGLPLPTERDRRAFPVIIGRPRPWKRRTMTGFWRSPGTAAETCAARYSTPGSIPQRI